MRKNITLIIAIAGIILTCSGCTESSQNVTKEKVGESVTEVSEVTTPSVTETEKATTKLAAKESTKTEISATTFILKKESVKKEESAKRSVSTTKKAGAIKSATTKLKTTTKHQTTTKKQTTTNTTTQKSLNISEYESYAKSYAKSLGMKIDSGATSWDNPVVISTSSTTAKESIRDKLDWYKDSGITSVWVYSEKVSNTKYNLYIAYA